MKKILIFPFFVVTLTGSALLVSVQGSAQTATAQTEGTPVQFVNPSSVPASKGYSQAVSIDLGNCRMLIISGQVALDKDGNLVGKGDFAQQANQVFSNIKSIAEDQGGTMSDVVKINCYVTDIGQLQTLREVRNKFIDLSHPPASTLAQVSQLFRSDIMLEVEATAIIQKKK